MRLYRVSAWAVALLGATSRVASGQPSATLASAFQADFAVPDAPAFKLLNLDPSAILRPQSVRELGFDFANFETPNGSFSLPRSLAIEVSPGLLIKSGDLTVSDYRTQKFLYALRMSVATRRDSTTGATSRVAIGVRLTLHDAADLRTDANYVRELQVTDLDSAITEIYVQARIRLGPDKPLALSASEQKQVDSLCAEIRKRWEKRYWNASVTDLAAAVSGQAEDSTGKGLKTDQLAFWGTVAKRVGSAGQLLLGLRLGLMRNPVTETTFHPSVDVAARFYMGTNSSKGFLELQQSWKQEGRPTSLLNGGLEVTLTGSVSAMLSAGIQRPGNGQSTQIITTFKLNTGLPGI